MAQYFIGYRGGMQTRPSPEEGAKQMQRWKDWLGELGEAVVNPGTPMGKSMLVGKEGLSADGISEPLSGFTVVEAASDEEAVEMAKGCPFLDMDGATLEVAQMMSMGG